MTNVQRVETLMRRRPAGWWPELCMVIPALDALADTPQPPEYHAEGDVAVHTRLAVATCPDNCDPDLLWIALLHDVGKPATTRQDGAGRITAHGHARLGADMAAEILARLGMPEQRRSRIVWAIRHHMFHHSWQLQDPAKLTKRQRAHLVNPDFPLLLEFLRIDSAASQSCNDGLRAYRFYRQLWSDVAGARQQ